MGHWLRLTSLVSERELWDSLRSAAERRRGAAARGPADAITELTDPPTSLSLIRGDANGVKNRPLRFGLTADSVYLGEQRCRFSRDDDYDGFTPALRKSLTRLAELHLLILIIRPETCPLPP